MNRRTWLASVGVGALGFSAGCSGLSQEEEYAIELRNGGESDQSIRVQVGENIVADGVGHFHDEEYTVEAEKREGPLPLDPGTPGGIRVVVDDDLIRLFPWPASLDSPGEIASSAVIYFTLSLPIGQQVQVFGDK